ncbi:MAG TPA: NADH-quinone oxidoreductase subunit C [Bacteroidales bacterium]|nr:NADH-quinone oxidoreductase subunit C [Bacteroidales bacterium]
MKGSYIEIENNSGPYRIDDIPVLPYSDFYNQTITFMRERDSIHCVAYFGIKYQNRIRIICLLADDTNGKIYGYSFIYNDNETLDSVTKVLPQMHLFEREVHENFGVRYSGHPWLKPVRYSYDRLNTDQVIENYPFYRIEGEELHEVGVGPVHAGVIEPGHFRFICHGEKVFHLEIQLGYQHRGVENLMVQSVKPLQKCILAESVAGDTVIGHTIAHAQLIESLAGIKAGSRLQIERCIALELERIAVHIGDTAALCGDVAYQLGQAVCEALRTSVINTTQLWCGNRFGKGLIRPGGSNYPLNAETAKKISEMISDTGRRFEDITERIFSLTSLMARFEDIGTVTALQAKKAGATGMAARSSGVARDIRVTHPFQYYQKVNVNTIIQQKGDVLSRALQRKEEVKESIRIINQLLVAWQENPENISKPRYDVPLKPDSFSVSLSEGWRGEICHAAFTSGDGKIMSYKIKDPSFHNWLMLALAVRNQEISDFPLCNKSFNLSYCGHDL